MLFSTLFPTPLGDCGLAWTSAGVACVQLPEASATATRARLRQRSGAEETAAWPAAVRVAIERLQSYLGGAATGFDDVPLDLARATEFERRVYTELAALPRGRTCTYGELAAAVGAPGAARAVGRAVGKNPVPVLIPCHRVLAAGGRPGGFSAPGGLSTKARLLALEGVVLPGREPTLFP